MLFVKSILSVFVVVLCLTFVNQVAAQSTLFNIPSTDVVAKKKVYLEFDFISHLEDHNNGGFQTYVPRAVVGASGSFAKCMSLKIVRACVASPPRFAVRA